MPNPDDLRGPDLVSIGVRDPSKFPSTSTFPPKFSPSGFPVWHRLMLSEDFQYQVTLGRSPEEVWGWAIERYFVDCSHSMVFPFKIGPEQSKTDVAVFLLSSARRQLKAYFKKVDFFKKVKLFNTDRMYHFKENSFGVEITAQLYPIKDPTFCDWLVQHPPGPWFIPYGHKAKVFVRKMYDTPDASCYIYLDCSYMVRPKLTIKIELGSPVVLPFHWKSVSKDYIHRYVEENIWLPLARSFRFDNAGWRLF